MFDNTLKSLQNFYKTHSKFIGNIGQIGAISPTSKSAIQHVYKLVQEYIDQSGSTQGHILELGPGTGNITHYLLKTPYHISAFETDQDFCQDLLAQYHTYSNFTLYHESAEYIDRHIDQVDIIVTTIPMTLLGDKADTILQQCAHVLKPGGLFVSAQFRSKQEKKYQYYIGAQDSAEWFIGLQPIRVTSFLRNRQTASHK